MIEKRVLGVYHQDFLSCLGPLSSIGFDFRPTSLNFIQIYKAQELLQNKLGIYSKIHLQFNAENPFIINEIIKALRPHCLGEIIVDEYGPYSAERWSKIQAPVWWHLSPEKLDQLANPTFILPARLQGFSFTSETAEMALMKFEECSHLNLGNIHLDLKLDWEGGPPAESILDYFSFSSFTWEISPAIELSYRNPNIPKFSQIFHQMSDELAKVQLRRPFESAPLQR